MSSPRDIKSEHTNLTNTLDIENRMKQRVSHMNLLCFKLVQDAFSLARWEVA